MQRKENPLRFESTQLEHKSSSKLNCLLQAESTKDVVEDVHQ